MAAGRIRPRRFWTGCFRTLRCDDDRRRLADLVEKYRDQVRTFSLDVADEDAAYTAVQVAVEAFGRLNVG